MVCRSDDRRDERRDRKRSRSRERKRSRSRDKKRSHSRDKKRSHSRDKKGGGSRDKKEVRRSRSKDKKRSHSQDRGRRKRSLTPILLPGRREPFPRFKKASPPVGLWVTFMRYLGSAVHNYCVNIIFIFCIYFLRGVFSKALKFPLILNWKKKIPTNKCDKICTHSLQIICVVQY